MPTIIALDTSLSMQRTLPGRSDTYHQLALKGISHLLENLASFSKLEYVALLTFSSACDIKVDFTRDYDQIRLAMKKVDTGDKACLLSMLKSISSIMSSNWGSQNICQVVIFTDCGVGFRSNSLMNFLKAYAGKEQELEYAWLRTIQPYKLNFICMGLHSDSYFKRAVIIYQQLLDCAALKGQLFMTKPTKDPATDGNGDANSHSHKSELGRTAMCELIERLCEASFKPMEVVLKCGGYFRLECPILIWPSPTSYQPSIDKIYTLERQLDVCGFLALTDIGSPASLSRHLILPKIEREKTSNSNRRGADKANSNATKQKSPLDVNNPNYEFEKLEQDIREFYTKDGKETDAESGDDTDAVTLNRTNNSSMHTSEHQKESLCALLHGALKVENLAALVLLSDNWYGFIYAFADSKKKSNLMLNIMPPGTNVIPWLGDFKMFGLQEDLQPGEACSFPVKAEKRSYSQSCVVWIRHASLQSDIQKVLRHAKKMPDKLQHFYKELNRIRRAALSIGFIELLDALATLLEKECAHLAISGTNTECTMQLQHAAAELRKTTHRDFKVPIVPLQKFGAPGIAPTPPQDTAHPPGFIY